jgi:glycosyltransferase involved in cell wall biosynthesis
MVVSHEATRTGAPRVALEVVRGLREAEAEVVAVVRRPGPLTHEFADAGTDPVIEPQLHVRSALRRLRARRIADWFEQKVARRVLRRFRPDLVYLNTVKSACYVRPALELGFPVVLHVHEPGAVARSTLSRYRLDVLLSQVALVACSPPVRDDLASDFGLPQNAIAYIPSPVNPHDIRARAHVDDPVGSPPEAVVGTCATADRRKGVDLWLEMVAAVRREFDPPPRFLWIGGVRDRGARRLARELRVDDVVDFVGEIANPFPLVAGMSVFTLASREDPFPVAVLEAMALARPVVAFAVGGVPEQLGDAGVLVPPGDVGAMADAVRALLTDEAARRRLGARASERVGTRFDATAFRAAVRELVEAQVGAPGDHAADGK